MLQKEGLKEQERMHETIEEGKQREGKEKEIKSPFLFITKYQSLIHKHKK
jgi:hypothetical protein